MKHSFISLLLGGTLLLSPATGNAALHVFACEPEWGSLAKEVGGDNVEVFTAISAQQDPHHVSAKPSLLSGMRSADLVVCSGASLEVGWLPILLNKAGNAKTQPGGPGFFLAAEVVPVLEKPVAVDRSLGDIHPEGNPHVHLDPHNIAAIAAALHERMKALDAAHAAEYDSLYADFSAKWSAAMLRWEKQAAPLRGMPVVVHHKAFSYLEHWLGLVEVGELEPKPGIPPTSSHLEELLVQLKAHPAKAILRASFNPEDASDWLSEKTGTPALAMPYTVGGDEQSGDLFALFDRTLQLLLQAGHAQ